MNASEIRSRFLDYFRLRGHQLVSSASLVPGDDPTLLFTNAGMVQFKKVFLGAEDVAYDRAVTSQKCVRAGGKHNDLEQVGITARHHTFFEMLGNFSFGDYFKRDAIHFAWEFLTRDVGVDADRLLVTVHHTDDEAFQLWEDIAGLGPDRIFRLGDEDNFWQMADTGPCGPCSEVHYDLRAESGRRALSTPEEFSALSDRGEILEIWNLVFMQFDRDSAGRLEPLPSPSIDTGAGLERLAAVLQGVESNYHTDLFLPLLERVAQTVGEPYDAASPQGVSYRVLADHARAVAFLLGDGVFPSNEGRGYVLRRILRRGVRHAWLLGLRRPALVEVVDAVIDTMAGAYPELRGREAQILTVSRQEEERFLATIEEGLERFEALAPEVQGDTSDGARERPVVSGAEAFKLYDTFGFPLDLTQIMARERGYEVDEEGFEVALTEQRERSRADRAKNRTSVELAGGLEDWTILEAGVEQAWTGWDDIDLKTSVVGITREDGRVGVILRDNPFYAEAGGQISDVGTVEGEGWRLCVEEVRRVDGRTAVFGGVEGELPDEFSGPVPASARVDRTVRHDIERNHTATHLLHAALRSVLGDHVGQRGSLVAPDRLRFDYSHPEPLTPDQIEAIEDQVNEAIWSDHPVRWEITARDEAVARGAMALFGEKYGDEVRVVEIPGISLELCGGTHLEHTGEAGLFVITRESGVASGVRRMEALTGSAAFAHLKRAEAELDELAQRLRVSRDGLARRVDALLQERDELGGLLDDMRRQGGAAETVVHEADVVLSDDVTIRYRAVRMKVKDAEDARAFGDAFREAEAKSVLTVASESPDGKRSLFVFVTDDLISHGIRAGDLVRKIAAVAGGRGGGRPHMAQGGIEEPERVEDALRAGEAVLRQAPESAPA